MTLEAIAFGLLLALASVPAVAALGRRRPGIVGTILLVLVAAPGATAWSVWKSGRSLDRLATDRRPIEVAQDGYVSSRTCKACHPGPYASWHASYHRTMTQFATPETVRAPFAGEQLTDEDGTYRLERRGDQFWVEMPDPAWRGAPALRPRVDKRIVMITGSHHYQVYWFPSGKARTVWTLPFIWLIEERRWINRGAAFLGPEHLTKDILGVWNNSCIKCHSTRGRPGPDELGEMDTSVAEIGIACEACHGPGEEHVRLQRDPLRRYRQHFGEESDETIVNPGELSARAASQVCGQCHSVWRHDGREGWIDWLQNGLRYRPGDDLSSRVLVVRYNENLELPRMREFTARTPSYRMETQFWRDGMVRVSGREFNGLLETPCFERGELTCMSCHRLHKDDADARPVSDWANDLLAPGMDGDLACLQCHVAYRDRPESHSHHAAASSGSRCYNCHMPHTTYGLLTAIRSHQVDSPDVAVDLTTGRPNACNLCHVDKTLEWSGRYLSQWYSIPLPEIPRRHRAVSEMVLWALGGDAGQRALAAWSLGWAPAREAAGDVWMAPYLAQLLDDPYQAVRFVAHRSLSTLPGFEDFEYDFLATPEVRRTAVLRAKEIWRRQDRGQVDGAQAVLLDPNGGLREEIFYPLLAHRDDRIVALHE